MTDAEEIKMLHQSLCVAREALRAPINEWKGECERLALDVINDALASSDHIVEPAENMRKTCYKQNMHDDDDDDNEVQGPMLPDGVEEINGNFYARCMSCGKQYELPVSSVEYSSEYSYCGGSPLCLP